MAVKFLSQEVSDLCIGKPALRLLPISATVSEALLALKRCGDTYVSVWTSDGPAPVKKAFAGKLCMVDIICYLCAEENISSPAAALKNPVSVLLSNETAALMRRVELHSRIIDALNLLLKGAHILWAPIRSVAGYRKKLGSSGGHSAGFCWLTQEDFARFIFNSIAIFSPIAALSVTQLGLVRSAGVLAVHHNEPALSFLPLIRRAIDEQTSVAVVTDNRKLIGEISPSTLACCNESVAAALAALSAGDLMAYIDWCGFPPDAALQTVKSILKEKGMQGMLELMEGKFSSPMFSSSSSSSSASSSSDEEEAKLIRRKRTRSMGSYLARLGRRSKEAIVCHPVSSLVAVMVQALAHRVGYVWVVDKDYSLVGIVVLRDILKVFGEQIDQAKQFP